MKYSIIFIFLLIFIFKHINCQFVVQKIIFDESNNFYSADGSKCIFRYSVIVDTGGSIFTALSNGETPYIDQFFGNTHYLSYKFNVPISQITPIILTVTTLSDTLNVNITNYSCDAIDFNLVDSLGISTFKTPPTTGVYSVLPLKFTMLEKSVTYNSLILSVNPSSGYNCYYRVHQIVNFFVYCYVVTQPVGSFEIIFKYLGNEIFRNEYSFILPSQSINYISTPQDGYGNFYQSPYSNTKNTYIFSKTVSPYPSMIRPNVDYRFLSNYMYISGSQSTPKTLLFIYNRNTNFEIGYTYFSTGQIESYNTTIMLAYPAETKSVLELIGSVTPAVTVSMENSKIVFLTLQYRQKALIFDNVPIAATFNNLATTIYINYPYGITGPNLNGSSPVINNQILIYFPPFFGSSYLVSTLGGPLTPPDNQTTDLVPPILVSINSRRLPNLSILVQMTITDNLSGVYMISAPFGDMTYRDLAKGTLVNGTFEKVFTYQYGDIFNTMDVYISIYDYSGNVRTETINPFIGENAAPSFQFVTRDTLPMIKEFYFASNNINVTSSGFSNILYIDFVDNSPIINSAIFFEPLYDNVILPQNIARGSWDSNIRRFVIPFYIPQKIFDGSLIYNITIPETTLSSVELQVIVGTNATLNIISTDADRMPPIISFYNVSSTVTTVRSITWSFDIEDIGSGLKDGILHIRSTFDYKPYIFSISSVGKNSRLDSYTFTINLESPYCYGNFYVSYLRLVDNGGAISEFNITANRETYFNPFYRVIPGIVPYSCQTVVSPPLIGDLQIVQTIISNSLLDVGSNSRTLNINFTIGDATYGVSKRHIPVLYLTSMLGEYISLPTSLVLHNGTKAYYIAKGEVPVGFGIQAPQPGVSDGVGILSLSISGYANTNYYVSGGYLNSSIIVHYSSTTPNVLSSSKLKYNLASSLTVYGKKFAPNSVISVTSALNTATNYTGISISSSMIYIDQLPGYISEDISITVFSNNIMSNVFLIPVEKSSDTPVIPSQQCTGTPLCGGTNNGVCSPTGCQCINGWQGNDCLSRTVNTTEPGINPNQPSIDNDFEVTLPNGETVTLKSLINLLSLDEYDHNNLLVSAHPLTIWKFSNLTTTTNSEKYHEYMYSTEITQSNVVTTVRCFIQWFKVQQTVNFAGQSIYMNPSTLKYRIELSNYYFGSGLNHLELVFSASVAPPNSDGQYCSYQETGTPVNEDSDYFKLQINSVSLYGRFVKRGIVDNRPQVLSNVIKTSESSTNITILIPHYQSNVLLDPDFSLLIDSTDAESKEGSVCSSKSTGLTRAQLAGIIVASVVGGLILIIIIVTIILKTSHNQKVLKIAIKMRGLLRRKE
ncbi:hypothetical protein DLAC_10825 [Tieghemostelium lacteum]|uniref:EGF-like domain-containing protein n=1 Tax=Tieghemostelium lacteum TaxID=361077 RepID=A0A151Z3V9_TIELA|nr:hypothetical protein DLAC_10825 [Tieghemostelium lacteum]|eukprot:KYQ88650.1 hypothetical protein DLAC_10825 [Tieghemostelium lacteum]